MEVPELLQMGPIPRHVLIEHHNHHTRTDSPRQVSSIWVDAHSVATLFEVTSRPFNACAAPGNL
jgi:hypothetical protein